MLNDIMLSSGITQGRLFTFPVTAGTEVRDVTGEGGRFNILILSDIVGTVTIGTSWCILVVFGGQYTMGTLVIQVHYICMTDRAVNFARILADRVFLVINIDMAFGTGNAFFLMD